MINHGKHTLEERTPDARAPPYIHDVSENEITLGKQIITHFLQVHNASQLAEAKWIASSNAVYKKAIHLYKTVTMLVYT